MKEIVTFNYLNQRWVIGSIQSRLGHRDYVIVIVIVIAITSFFFESNRNCNRNRQNEKKRLPKKRLLFFVKFLKYNFK